MTNMIDGGGGGFDLTQEFLSYESERAIKYLQAKKLPYSVYGSARSCKAVLVGNGWYPAEYTPDGKTPSQNGVDVILFPLVIDDKVVNMIAFEPNKKPLQLYLRFPYTNLWALMEFIEGMLT